MRPHWKIEFAHFNFSNIFCVFAGLFNLRATFPFSTTILKELTNKLCNQSILPAKNIPAATKSRHPFVPKA
jgi:hypothetical protein